MLGYSQMWDQAIIDQGMMKKARDRMSIALQNRSDYEAVQNATGVPVVFVAPVHEREGSLKFNTHLHNGDPLTARTKHVPAGRPKDGKPPFTWAESAIDAIKLEGLDKVKNWSAERLLYEQHKYNGITKYPSGYVFAGTQYYKSGMWVRDHVYDPNARDTRPGTLVLAKALIALQPSLGNLSREPFPPKEVVDEHKEKFTKVSRVVRNAAGSAGTVAGGTEVAVKPKAAVQGFPVLQIGIGLCAVVFVVAAVWVLLKRSQAHTEIHQLWAGEGHP